MSSLILPLALVAYVLGIWAASMVVVYRSPSARRWAGASLVAAWLLHLAEIVRGGVAAGSLPLTNLAEYLLVLGWLVLTLHLFVWFGLKIAGAGLVLPPLAALSTFMAWGLFPIVGSAPADRAPAILVFHTSVSTVGMAILGLAFAMAVLYLLQDRALKTRKTLGLLQRFPALEQCDKIGLHSLLIGFLLLTAGIGTGLGVRATFDADSWSLGPKEIFPMLAWLVIAATLASRTLLGFRGTRSAYLTIAGFTLGVLTVLGMTL